MDAILINQEKKTKITEVMVCQHLGAKFDPKLSFSFPSANNVCYRATPPGGVATDHQEDYCLTAKCAQCPVYQPDWQGPLPKSIKAHRRRVGIVLTRLALFGLAVGVILAALVYAFIQNSSANRLVGLERGLDIQVPAADRAGSTATGTAAPQAVIPIIPTGTRLVPTATATVTGTAIASPTGTTTPTASPTWTTTVCAPPDGWVAYTVKRGDSLALFREIYNLRKSELLAANCNPGLEDVTIGQVFYLPYLPPTPTVYHPPPVDVPTQRPPPQPPDSRP